MGDGELKRLIRQGASGSSFGRIGFQGIEDGLSTLSTATAAEKIKTDTLPGIIPPRRR